MSQSHDKVYRRDAILPNMPSSAHGERRFLQIYELLREISQSNDVDTILSQDDSMHDPLIPLHEQLIKLLKTTL